MAFNQASFFLFPPRFGPALACDHAAKTASGEPLEIISTCVVDPIAPKVSAPHLRQWFIDRGFTEREAYGGSQVLFRGRHTNSLGTQGIIEVSLPVREDEIQVLYIRFLLTERTPDQIPEWKDLIWESAALIFCPLEE